MATSASTDHAGSGLAERYAVALYELADERHDLDSVVEQMAALGRLIDDSTDFRRLLEAPMIDPRVAGAAARAVLEKAEFGETVKNFVGIVAANRRLATLRRLVAGFATLVAERRGVVTAHVASALKLTDVQREQLRARLIEAGYGRVEIEEVVDPSLLGGLSVRVGARLYDNSIRSRLQRLSYAMKGAA